MRQGEGFVPSQNKRFRRHAIQRLTIRVSFFSSLLLLSTVFRFNPIGEFQQKFQKEYSPHHASAIPSSASRHNSESFTWNNKHTAFASANSNFKLIANHKCCWCCFCLAVTRKGINGISWTIIWRRQWSTMAWIIDRNQMVTVIASWHSIWVIITIESFAQLPLSWCLMDAIRTDGFPMNRTAVEWRWFWCVIWMHISLVNRMDGSTNINHWIHSNIYLAANILLLTHTHSYPHTRISNRTMAVKEWSTGAIPPQKNQHKWSKENQRKKPQKC